jgi:hypothetical protein
VISIQPYGAAEGQAIAADMALAKEVARVLNDAYKGWSWATHCDSRTGILTVENWDLSERYGFVIHMNKLTGAQEIKRAAILAGGEFLERHGLPATKANDADRDAKQARAWFA